MRDVVILQALRTPIGKFLGSFSSLSAADLGTAIVRATVERSGVPPAAIDELIFGCARQAGGGPNVARQISVRAGIPESVPAFTVNMACASGLKSIALGAEAIASGRADVVVAGGVENMTRVPFLLDRMREGYRLGNAELIDGMYRDGFLCPLAKELMGETAENLVDRYQIPRDEQDRFALASQRKAAAAWSAGRFRDEVVAVEVPAPKGALLRVDRDEHARADTTLDGLAKLPPVFRKTGTVTPGNASGITDGAAALVLASEDYAKKLGAQPLARIGPATQVGVDPHFMGIGPVPAVQKLLAKIGTGLDAFDLVEINEAFAAQVIACDRELHFPSDRTNVNGGAIALGHPIGCTGARIVVTLVHEMRRRGAQRGLATLCVSGGLGLASSFLRA
ncbi:MAG: acetyl-CoA C-acetyltransferase [Planctomycetes bacterium]|nr:acetyl-CoA C-acetyltransferase [Planctomycetota bacterium]MBI3846102.1 acetyl-CoA C-acetyltransferase [Planctomycetota bacterium]